MKILEIVKFNDHYAYVVDEDAPLVYHEETVPDKVYGKRFMLVGENSIGRMSFLTFQRHSGHFKAFAGREFQVQMEDGTVRTLKDDWWDGGSSEWSQAHGVKMYGLTYNTLDRLVDCCVFCGSYVREDKLQALLNEFKSEHPDYTPWEYKDWHDHCREIQEATYDICPKCRCLGKELGATCPKCGHATIKLKDF